jgi:hypothetical protein
MRLVELKYLRIIALSNYCFGCCCITAIAIQVCDGNWIGIITHQLIADLFAKG